MPWPWLRFRGGRGVAAEQLARWADGAQFVVQRHGGEGAHAQLQPLVGVDHPGLALGVHVERAVQRHQRLGHDRLAVAHERERAVGSIGHGQHGAAAVGAPARYGAGLGQRQALVVHGDEEMPLAAPGVHLRRPAPVVGPGPGGQLEDQLGLAPVLEVAAAVGHDTRCRVPADRRVVLREQPVRLAGRVGHDEGVVQVHLGQRHPARRLCPGVQHAGQGGGGEQLAPPHRAGARVSRPRWRSQSSARRGQAEALPRPSCIAMPWPPCSNTYSSAGTRARVRAW